MDTEGHILETEFFHDQEAQCEPYLVNGEFDLAAFNYSSSMRNQLHYQVITNDKQVQIYEELNLDKACNFTTSFVHRVHSVKDNRLLPDGWKASDYFKADGELMYQYMQATDPHNVNGDVDYEDEPNVPFVGGDSLEYKVVLPPQYSDRALTVEATIYFQAIPPYWLKQRFDLAPKGEATRRLFYLASHLDLRGTLMDDWKFKITSLTKEVKNSLQ